jgi:hypothetical protein
LKSRQEFLLFLILIGLITMSFFEPVVGYLVIILVTILISKYLNTTFHEIGHFIAGKAARFNIKEVVIGEQLERKFLRFNVFNTSFVFNYGAGGSTLAQIYQANNLKVKILIYILGGIILQTIVVTIIFIQFGFGKEERFIPFIYEMVSILSIFRSLIPRNYYFNNQLFPSDGLLVIRIIQMSKEEVIRKYITDAPDFT